MSANKLYTKINSQTIDILTIFAAKTGSVGQTNATAFPQTSGLDLISNATTALSPNGTNTNYKINGADFSAIFNPVYFDKNTVASETITIPAWAKSVGFIIVGSGNKGGVAYTDSWQSIAGYSQGTTAGTGNEGVTGGGNAVYYFSGVFQNQSLKGFNPLTFGIVSFNPTTYNQITNYTTSTANYPGGGGGGGGCVAGVYSIPLGGAGTFTYSLGAAGSDSYIQFNETARSTTSKCTVKSGGEVTANTTLTQNTTDTIGTFGTTSSNSNNVSDSTTTVNQAINAESARGYFTKLYHNSGKAGTVGTSGGDASAAIGGFSGLKSSTTIQSNFLPCSDLLSDYGNGGGGSSTSTANNGKGAVLRYWFLV
jgi:hypothetical protein